MLLHYGQQMIASPAHPQVTFKLPGACDTPHEASSEGTASTAGRLSSGRTSFGGRSLLDPHHHAAEHPADLTVEVTARAGAKGGPPHHGPSQPGSHWHDAGDPEAVEAAHRHRAVANWAKARRAVGQAVRISSGFFTLRDMAGSPDVQVLLAAMPRARLRKDDLLPPSRTA